MQVLQFSEQQILMMHEPGCAESQHQLCTHMFRLAETPMGHVY